MNLLASAHYDPAVAVTKATTAGTAMAAFDTTNVRLTGTVPACGKLYWRIKGAVHGATTLPQILLGVMNGAAVVARAAAMYGGGNIAATSIIAAWAEGTINGLTPGAAFTLDAAWCCETGVASTGIKYGGPDNNTVNNAFGGLTFELWNPQPVPVATPGAANGLLIAGANAASSFATLTANLTGNVTGSVASVTADVGITQAGADKVWGSAARTLTSFGTLVADVWAAATRRLTDGTNIVLAKGTGVTGFNDIAATAIVSNGAITTAAGKVSGVALVDTLTTYTGNTPQTGDAFARIGVNGGGLTALGDSRMDNLNATVSSRLPTSSYVAPGEGSVDLTALTAICNAIKAKTDKFKAGLMRP